MKVSIESTQGLETTLKIVIPSSNIEAKVSERLQKAAKTVALKGFRKGKVPVRVVQQHFGRGIRQEIVGEAINTGFTDAISKEKLNPVGQPKVDILEDNAQSARERLFNGFIEVYEKYFKEYSNANFIKSIKFILDKNIIHGDALTLMQVDSENPVTFSEWAIVNSKLKRRDFTLSDLLAYAPFEKGTLFSDVGEEVNIPEPIKEHTLVNYDEAFKTC